MFKRTSGLIAIAVLAGMLTACIHQPLVKHEEVLIYNRAYDYTYDGVLRALDNAYPWQVSNTNKEAGTITAYNQKYWDSLDADKRTAVILVKRIDRRKTSVELSPESQNVIGVADILKSIDQVLGTYK